MDQKVSHAEFKDFTLKERRHCQGVGHKSSLSSGLVPEQDTDIVPHLNRSRVAHDAADMYCDPDSFASTAQRQDSASHWQSSYQAMSCDNGPQRKKEGKKIVPNLAATKTPSSFLGSGGGTFHSGSKDTVASLLQQGTTKQSGHIAGYCGHIPKDNTTQPPQVRSAMDKTLIIENYKPIPGYTGRRML